MMHATKAQSLTMDEGRAAALLGMPEARCPYSLSENSRMMEIRNDWLSGYASVPLSRRGSLKGDLIDDKAWADAVTQQHEGRPLWVYLTDNPGTLGVARALLNAYLNVAVRPTTASPK